MLDDQMLDLFIFMISQLVYTNRSTLAYIAGWYVFSLSISVYNKWMFGEGLDFHFPVLITAFHQLVLMGLSTLSLWMRPDLRPESRRIPLGTYIRTILPCALASSGDIGLSNVSIRYVSLSLYTMLKTSSLVFVLLFGLLFRLERFNWRLVVIVGVMLLSVAMMVSKPSQGHSDPFGVVLVLSASMVSGLRWSFTQILLKSNPYTPNPISTIFFIAPTMFVTLALFGLVFEGWGNFVSSHIWEARGVFATVVLMVIPGFLAFMMTLCEFKLLSVAQVITLSIAGIFKEVLTIGISAVVFGDRLSVLNVCGLVLTFGDILWYNYYRYRENGGYEVIEMEDVPEAPERSEGARVRRERV